MTILGRGVTARERGSTAGAKRLRSRRIRAGEFKAVRLKQTYRVRDTGEEYVITKRVRPVAKRVPATGEGLRPFLDRSRGVVSAREDALAYAREGHAGACAARARD